MRCWANTTGGATAVVLLHAAPRPTSGDARRRRRVLGNPGLRRRCLDPSSFSGSVSAHGQISGSYQASTMCWFFAGGSGLRRAGRAPTHVSPAGTRRTGAEPITLMVAQRAKLTFVDAYLLIAILTLLRYLLLIWLCSARPERRAQASPWRDIGKPVATTQVIPRPSRLHRDRTDW